MEPKMKDTERLKKPVKLPNAKFRKSRCFEFDEHKEEQQPTPEMSTHNVSLKGKEFYKLVIAMFAVLKNSLQVSLNLLPLVEYFSFAK